MACASLYCLRCQRKTFSFARFTEIKYDDDDDDDDDDDGDDDDDDDLSSRCVGVELWICLIHAAIAPARWESTSSRRIPVSTLLATFGSWVLRRYSSLCLHPCLTTTRHVWVVGFEAVFPAANVSGDTTLVFKAFVTKDHRQAEDSVTVRLCSNLSHANPTEPC